MGGVVMGRGALLHILKSRLYRGEIAHKGAVHQGLHPPLVPQLVFDAVQTKMVDHATVRRRRGGASAAPLKGILFDAHGRPMSPSFGYGRKGRLYRYYIAPQPDGDGPGDSGAIRRLSAPAVEEFLGRQLRRLASLGEISAPDLPTLLRRVEVRTDCIHLVVNSAAIFGDDHPELALGNLRRRLEAGEQAVSQPDGGIRIVLVQRLQLRGGRTTILGDSPDRARTISPRIVTALKRAHADLLALKASPFSTEGDLQESSSPLTQQSRQLSRMALMAPELQRDIVAGLQPRGLGLLAILKNEMPLAWADQRIWLETIARA